MSKENFDWGNVAHTPHDPHEDEQESGDYESYKERGGRIDKEAYASALRRAKDAGAPSTTLLEQTERMAHNSGIELHSGEGSSDERVVLYGILRADRKPADVEHHHEQMSDQQLFAEALRMVGDTDSLDKFVSAHSHMSF